MTTPLYVIKLGSSTVLNGESIFDEIAHLVKRGAKIVLILGGSAAIEKKYQILNRKLPTVTLKGGNSFRYCTPEEMPYIIQAYQEFILGPVEKELRRRNIRAYASIGQEILVSGVAGKPLRSLQNGREVIIRDSLIGQYSKCNKEFFSSLLQSFDVLCITPPIKDENSDNYLNIDADMLAAHLSIDLKASHLRFVTSTPGIMQNTNTEQLKTLESVYDQDELPFVTGRMKQKVRAAKLAGANGIADIHICGPHSLLNARGKTWFWPTRAPSAELNLLTESVSINSVSRDENELACFLVEKCRQSNLEAFVDAAGNIVAQKGNGRKKLLMLGHIDTVPYHWRAKWTKDGLTGRGVVDAKSSLVNFLEVLKSIEVPPEFTIQVVGATEEEVSSSKGAFFARDNYHADAVIIGEPSGVHAVTLGYFGLFKVEVRAKITHAHTAGQGFVSAADRIVDVAREICKGGMHVDPNGLSTVLHLQTHSDSHHHHARAVINFRVSPSAKLDELEKMALSFINDDLQIEILRATPGIANPRSSTLAKSFIKAFSEKSIRPKFLLKKGTSDMNTLATTWKNIPMLAYGPGDASLDHTDKEILTETEFLEANEILLSAVNNWIEMNKTPEMSDSKEAHGVAAI